MQSTQCLNSIHFKQSQPSKDFTKLLENLSTKCKNTLKHLLKFQAFFTRNLIKTSKLLGLLVVRRFKMFFSLLGCICIKNRSILSQREWKKMPVLLEPRLQLAGPNNNNNDDVFMLLSIFVFISLNWYSNISFGQRSNNRTTASVFFGRKK